MSKGIANPWAPEAQHVPTIEAEGKSTGTVVYEGDLPREAPLVGVVFRGQTYAVRVRVVRQTEGVRTRDLAVIVLGRCLRDLWRRAPKSKEVFRAEALTETPPRAPKVTLGLGDLTLYATAGTMDPDLAIKMAIDRVALALMACRSDPPALAVLAEYKVDTVVKA